MVGANARSAVKRYGSEVTLRRHEGTANMDGQAVHEFGDPEPIWASVRPEEVGRDWGIEIEGEADAVRYVMAVLELPAGQTSTEFTDSRIVTPPVEEDDRVLIDGSPWRCVKRLKSFQNDVSRFALVEDGRGASDDRGDPDDGTGGGSDQPPFPTL